MTLGTTRICLFLVFFVAYLIHASAFFISYHRGRIYADEMRELMVIVLKIYLVHFAVIMGGFFGKKSKPKQVEMYSFWVALVSSVGWNLLLLWYSVLFGYMGKGTIIELSTY